MSDSGQRTPPPALSEAARRRRAALAGHTGSHHEARDLLADDAPRVRATALAALARAGAVTEADVAAAIADADPLVRRRACAVAVALAGVDLRALLDDPDPLVVETAAWALGERGARGAVAVDALIGVAGGHSDTLCREAAVAALGAIGDPAALPTILAAMSDKPTIRRRAVLALAAFEGPQVEAALRRALDDRDWQVRQAAEDLLAGATGGDPDGG